MMREVCTSNVARIIAGLTRIVSNKFFVRAYFLVTCGVCVFGIVIACLVTHENVKIGYKLYRNIYEIWTRDPDMD